MTRNPATIPLDMPVIEIARKLIDARIHRLPVTDGETFVGMVTTSDLVRMIADGRLVAR
jgi:CBS domain-containing protein